MFQMTSREPMEPVVEEAGDLVELEDVLEFEHTNDSIERTDESNEDNLDEGANAEEPALPNLLLD